MRHLLKIKSQRFSFVCCAVLLSLLAISVKAAAQKTLDDKNNERVDAAPLSNAETVIQPEAQPAVTTPDSGVSSDQAFVKAEPIVLAANNAVTVAPQASSRSSTESVEVASSLALSPETNVSSASSQAMIPSSVSNSSSAATNSNISSVSAEVSLPAQAAAATITEAPPAPLSFSKFILGREVKPNSSVRLTWSSETAVGGFSEETPILVVNGATPGKTLCLTGAVHGDELNGIEVIRRVIYSIEPAALTGTIIGVPVANIMGFRRNSRYLPDRRDWNRYFPGNTHGSSASRLAHSFFSNIIMHCDALVDIHTGSFHRANLVQLRADLSDENVAKLAQSFGAIAVLNGRGNPSSLRAAAVRAGIPAVTLEAGEPMAIQSKEVEEGVTAINTLLAKMGMYGKQKRWTRIAPVYYRSAWVRANQSGILFSKATLGQRVREDDVLGTVTDPITNARTTIRSPYSGRIIGMALDQVVLPGFAAYHIGIQTPEAILIEESQVGDGMLEEDEEDGDDSGVDPIDEMDEPETGVSKAQDRTANE
jgi:predicted deacylase